MIKLIFLPIFVLLLSSCTLFPKSNDSNIDLNSPVSPAITNSNISTITPTKNMTNNNIVSLTTKYGQIVIKLYQNEAPNTVKNFLSKADSGYYDNLIFHRVIPGFMAQGGDPQGTGMGGGKQPSELNSIPFRRGSVGLARTAESKDVSNDSQFFICFTDDGCAHLTNEYVNFGEVISGFEALDKIVIGDKIISISSKTK